LKNSETIKITAPLPSAILKALEDAQEDEQRFENLEDLALFIAQRAWECVEERILEW
tara:strand:- start:1273 stop:1443 length:171 start_codon:yes stop_codon:yes gene_type:complete